MRRIFSILLTAVMLLPLFATVFAVAQGDAAVPMCCRRGGDHHCMAMAGVQDGGAPKLRMHCPALSRVDAVSQQPSWMAGERQNAGTALLVHPASLGQVEAGYRISYGRARQKRGPPTQNS